MAKISIIVPVYNTERYLKECIDSLINQTLEDIEIIIINDGSTDDSDKIIKEYDDKRIKYINKSNEGIGKTRNLGIEISIGEYLSFIDSDDYISLDFCEKMYKKAIKDNCDLVICDYFEVREKIESIKFKTFIDASLKENPQILNSINLGPCNKIYKNSLFIDNNNRFEENLKYEDAPFVCKMLKSAKRIGKIDECLTYYVIHNNSQTTIRDNKIFDIIKISDIIVKTFQNENYIKNELTNIIVMILTDYTIQGRFILDKKVRNRFIDEVFTYLNNFDHRWRKCPYLKNFKIYKRIVKQRKILTKIYCNYYILIHKKSLIN